MFIIQVKVPDYQFGVWSVSMKFLLNTLPDNDCTVLASMAILNYNLNQRIGMNMQLSSHNYQIIEKLYWKDKPKC